MVQEEVLRWLRGSPRGGPGDVSKEVPIGGLGEVSEEALGDPGWSKGIRRRSDTYGSDP